MAKKNMGHYEGEVEDIDTNSLIFQSLLPIHREIIQLTRAKVLLSNEIKDIDDRISEIRSTLKPLINEYDWLWEWEMKRTNVKWKEEFVKALGQPKAEQVIKKYKTNTYPQLGIKYVDPIPDSIKQIKPNPPKLPLVKHRLKAS